jgi:superkiller protein 3
LIAAGNIVNIDKKIEVWSALHSIDSNRFEVVHNLGIIYSRHKSDYVKGTPFLERAISLNPNNKDAIRDLGITYGMSGQYEKSERLLTDATKRFPNDGQLFYNLAITLYNLKKMDEAQAAFDKASQLDRSIKPVKINQ